MLHRVKYPREGEKQGGLWPAAYRRAIASTHIKTCLCTDCQFSSFRKRWKIRIRRWWGRLRDRKIKRESAWVDIEDALGWPWVLKVTIACGIDELDELDRLVGEVLDLSSLTEGEYMAGHRDYHVGYESEQFAENALALLEVRLIGTGLKLKVGTINRGQLGA